MKCCYRHIELNENICERIIRYAYVFLRFGWFVDIHRELSGMHRVVALLSVDLWKIVDARSFFSCVSYNSLKPLKLTKYFDFHPQTYDLYVARNCLWRKTLCTYLVFTCHRPVSVNVMWWNLFWWISKWIRLIRQPLVEFKPKLRLFWYIVHVNIGIISKNT